MVDCVVVVVVDYLVRVEIVSELSRAFYMC